MSQKMLSLAFLCVWLVASNAVTVPNPVKQAYNSLSGDESYLVLKLDKNNVLRLDKQGSEDWDNILDDLPSNDCRFVVYIEDSFQILAKWCPDKASTKDKYQVATKDVKSVLSNAHLFVEGTNADDLSRTSILQQITHVAASRMK